MSHFAALIDPRAALARRPAWRGPEPARVVGVLTPDAGEEGEAPPPAPVAPVADPAERIFSADGRRLVGYRCQCGQTDPAQFRPHRRSFCRPCEMERERLRSDGRNTARRKQSAHRMDCIVAMVRANGTMTTAQIAARLGLGINVAGKVCGYLRTCGRLAATMPRGRRPVAVWSAPAESAVESPSFATEAA